MLLVVACKVLIFRKTGKVEASTRVDGNPVSQDLFKVPVRAHALKERSSDILRPFIIRF